MSEAFQIGSAKIVWGVPKDIRPVVTELRGRVRIRLRKKDTAYAFVKSEGGIRKFVLFDEGDKWTLGYEHGRNIRK